MRPRIHMYYHYRLAIQFVGISVWLLLSSAGGQQLSAERIVHWPQFRGHNSSGIVEGKAPPISFGPGKNEIWNMPVAPGHSSPCIAGDFIFLTTFNRSERLLSLVCINRHEGKVVWQRDTQVEEFEKGHPSFNPASSSPATDGERVVAYFGSYGLLCYDIDGTKLWEVRMPLPRTFGGNATSPSIQKDKVILYRGNLVDHYILAVNKNTGEEIWRVPQLEKFQMEMACTACPIISGNNLIFHGARSIQAVDLDSGKTVWTTKAATTATSTPIIADGEVVVAAWNKMGEPELRPDVPAYKSLISSNDKDKSGNLTRDEWPTLWAFHRPEGQEAPMNGGKIRFHQADRNRDGIFSENEWGLFVKDVDEWRSRYKSHGIMAIKLDSSGIVPKNNIRTLFKRGIPEIPSPLYYKGKVYFVKNGGILTCLDLKSGRREWIERTKGGGTHYASPLIAGNHLYSTSGFGEVSVISLGDFPEIKSINKMGEEVYATPAIVDGIVYIRTHSKLYAFGNQN